MLLSQFSGRACLVLAKTVTGQVLPLLVIPLKQGVVSGFHMAWTLLNQMNYGRKPCSLIVLTL
jgi:hypothetical protein